MYSADSTFINSSVGTTEYVFHSWWGLDGRFTRCADDVWADGKSSLSFLARKYISAKAMISAHITPSSKRNPKSKLPTISSMPMNPNANPASTEKTNWATAISCLLICLTNKRKKNESLINPKNSFFPYTIPENVQAYVALEQFSNISPNLPLLHCNAFGHGLKLSWLMKGLESLVSE